MRKLIFWLSLLGLVIGAAAVVQGAETKVGGHLKLSLFDYSDGTHTTGNNDFANSYYNGFSFTEIIFFISQEISDTLSVDVEPMFSASTGATPKLHSNIGAQKNASISPTFGGFDKGLLKARLPYQVEVAFGIVKPRFTLDYGGELFWEDEYNGSKFTANPFLGAMHETGFEIYRNFELPGGVSLPAYLYLLNGASEIYSGAEFADNNRHPMVMLHVEPATGPVKWTASYAYGKWDANEALDETRFSLGGEYSFADFKVRGEYAGGKWVRSIPGTFADAESYGYYVKLFYRVFPWMRAMVDLNLADNNFNGFFFTGPGAGERYLTVTPVLQFSLGESVTIFTQYDIADWRVKDNSDKLQFKRFTVGCRTTF